MPTEDIFVDKMLKRILITIIIAAIIIVSSLLLSAFMPFDLYQKIVVAISGIVIAIAFIAVVWIQWTKNLIRQEDILKS